MPTRRYQELKVWQAAMDLAEKCHCETRSFPKEELFGLTNQIRRAAGSIPANIAEGQGRQSYRDFLRYLNIARGSLNELETHLILSRRIGLMETSIFERLLQSSDEISRMLAGLRQALKRKL